MFLVYLVIGALQMFFDDDDDIVNLLHVYSTAHLIVGQVFYVTDPWPTWPIQFTYFVDPFDSGPAEGCYKTQVRRYR